MTVDPARAVRLEITTARADTDHGAGSASEPWRQQADPVGARLYTWPTPPPTGEWAYCVDDFGIRYRRPGWWPFRRGDAATERREVAQARRAAARRGVPLELGDQCGWASVRLAPDTAYCAAGQNYLLVWPDTSCAWRATADLHLYVRPQGACAVVVACTVEVDLRQMTATVHRVHETWAADLRAQAVDKAGRLLACLAEHVARRDAGRRTVPTAYTRWHRERAGAR